jgi:hypothetical protein
MRASILNKFTRDNEMVKGFQKDILFQNNNDKLFKEMQEVNRNLKNQKNSTIINVPKMDLGYEIWKMNNLNWK